MRVSGSEQTAIQRYLQELSVQHAHRNFLYYTTPDDPLYVEQWGLNQANDVDIDAPEAWGTQTGNTNVRIAVLDTGVDITHLDIQPNLWTHGEIPDNNVDDDGNGFVDDVHGWNFTSLPGSKQVKDDTCFSHGTHVAGIIAAKGNNGQGVTGVMWTAQLMVIKAFTGPRGEDPASSASIVSGINYAKNNGAHIVNGSFAGTSAVVSDQSVRDAIEQASNVLFVFSAGNQDVNNDSNPRFPCAWPSANIICVAGVDPSGNRWVTTPGADGSNYGVISVDLGAPAQAVKSTLRTDCQLSSACVTTTCLDSIGKDYGNLTGNSMATAFVSGVAGLMKAQNPTYTVAQLKEYLLLAGQPTPTGAMDGITHMGTMVNAQIAIKAFGDSFDDAADGSSFFDNNSTTGTRWAVAQNGSSRCDIFVRTVSGTADRVAEVKFAAGSDWTLASYEADYLPGNAEQTLVLRVTTPDGSDFVGKKGRIGIGIVGETGRTQETNCAATPNGYTKVSFGGSSMGGIELDTGKPFIFFDPPYSENLYSAVSLTGVRKLSIAVRFRSADAAISISNTVTGQVLFSLENIPFPANWNWTGTLKAAFMYYGLAGGTSGTLYTRAFLSAR